MRVTVGTVVGLVAALALHLKMISSRFVGLTAPLTWNWPDVPSPDFEPADT
jgi:hypothetical protein